MGAPQKYQCICGGDTFVVFGTQAAQVSLYCLKCNKTQNVSDAIGRAARGSQHNAWIANKIAMQRRKLEQPKEMDKYKTWEPPKGWPEGDK